MPVQYSGIVEEHLAVRKAVGLFDVSHMGEIEIRGAGSARSRRFRHHQRRLQAERRPGAVFRPALRARRFCRRHPGAQSSRAITSSCASTPPTRRRISSISAPSTTSTPRSSSRATATPRSPCKVRSRCATLQKLTAAAISPPSAITGSPMARLPARRRASPAPATPAKMASKSTLPPSEAERIWSELLEAGARVRHQALRPGRAQHPAAGSQNGALRPRNRRLHHAARSRIWAGS